jgi:type IV secretory pathway VirB4 component
MSAFRFPGGDQRTTILGATGSGKSTCGLWMLAHQRLNARPWIIFDFKR